MNFLDYALMTRIQHMKISSSSKLSFIVVGTQKAGTTSLDHYFRLHPDILMPTKKELHFFDDDENYQKGENKYHHFFSYDTTACKKIKGECTPIYMYWHNVMSRIYRYNPKIKLIIALRNPMLRAWSHWSMEYTRGDEKADFGKALQLENQRLEQSLHRQHRIYSYVDRGYYARQLKHILQLFPKEQLFIFKSEELKKQPEKILDQLFVFLGVSNIKLETKYTLRQGSYTQKMQESHFNFILKKLSTDIDELEQILSWDCSSWRTFT